MFSQTNTVYPNFNVSKSRLVKSAIVVCVLLVSALLFFFVKKELKHLAAVILWFLLQLKVILCTFLNKKRELRIQIKEK